MMRHTATVLLVLAALSAANAFNIFVPKGKELIYSYKSEISSGTNIPKHYASQLFIDGKLHIQPEGSGLVVQLSDITYKLFNGKTYNGYKHDLHKLPLHEDAHDILRPFKISYNSNGQVKSISMEKDEKLFARNMHKAIASILQMETKKVDLKTKHSHAFSTTENNLFSKCTTEYNVLPEEDTVVVQKLHEMSTTSPIYSQSKTNLDFDYCEISFEEPLFHDSQQKYWIKENDKHHIVDCIKSTGSFRFRPFHAQSEDFTVSTKIDLDLLEIVPITKTRTRKSEQTEHDLTYKMYDSVDKDNIDFTNGRHSVDVNKHAASAEEVICRMADYLHDPINEKDSSINKAIKHLQYVDMTTLEKLLGNLQEKAPNACDVFYQILPYVGTHASVIFLKKLVHEKKVKDFIAVQMLAEFPGYVRNPTEALLKDVEDMLEWDDKFDSQVKRTAVLSFSSLMYVTFKNQNKLQAAHDGSDSPIDEYSHVLNNMNGHKQYSSFSERIKSFFKKSDIFTDYINKFKQMILEGKDTSTQLLGMLALFNTKSPYILEVLVPIATQPNASSNLLRVWASWMIAHVTVGNSDYIFDTFWPLMTNRHEPAEIRGVSYYILMESHPSLTRLLNIQNTLENERDSELYYLHYSYLSKMSRSTDPCHQKSQLNLAQVFKGAPEPLHRSFSHYYQSDYMNKKYEYGEETNYIYFGGKDSLTFKWEYNVQVANRRFNPYTITFRIEGLDEISLHRLRVNLKSTESLFNTDQIWDMFNSMCNNKDIVVYIERSNNKRVTHSIVLHGTEFTNGDRILEVLRILGITFVDNRSDIKMYEHSTLPFPTDIGLPVVFDIMMPSINRYHVQIKGDENDNSVAHFDNHYYFSNRFKYEVGFYNALADAWQGVGKIHMIEYQLPFYADLAVNRKQMSFKLSLKKYDKPYKDAISFKHMVNRQVFVKFDEDGCLQKSCPKCEVGVGAVINEDFQKKDVKDKIELDEYVLEFESDADGYWSESPLEQWKNVFAYTDKKNYNDIWDYLKLNYLSLYRIILTHPAPFSTKLSTVLTPSPKYQNAQIDYTARFVETVTPQEGSFLPGVKYNIRVTRNTKNKDAVLKTWDLHFTTEINCGHTLQNTKVDLIRTIPSHKDYRFSYEDERRWSLDDLTGNATVIIEDPDTHVEDIFDMTYVGKQLPEQKDPHHGYGVCLPYVTTDDVDYSSARCLAAHSSLRQYDYDIKAKNDIKHYMSHVDRLLNFYNCHYHSRLQSVSNIGDKEAKVTVTYPPSGKGINLSYDTLHRLHQFDNIPTYLSGPTNTHMSSLYMFLHDYGFNQKCRADLDTIKPDHTYHESIACKLDEYWTLYVGDAENDCDHGVFLKRVSGHLMAFKVLLGEHYFEIYPCGDNNEKFKFVVDGKEISDDMDFYSCEWLSYLYRESTHEVIINIPYFYITVRYSGHDIDIEIPRVDGCKFYGKCFM